MNMNRSLVRPSLALLMKWYSLAWQQLYSVHAIAEDCVWLNTRGDPLFAPCSVVRRCQKSFAVSLNGDEEGEGEGEATGEASFWRAMFHKRSSFFLSMFDVGRKYGEWVGDRATLTRSSFCASRRIWTPHFSLLSQRGKYVPVTDLTSAQTECALPGERLS